MGDSREIFKLQRPLATSEPIPQVLIYNETRSVTGQIPTTPALEGLFEGEYKIFVWGTVIGTDQGLRLGIEELIPEHLWPNW